MKKVILTAVVVVILLISWVVWRNIPETNVEEIKKYEVNIQTHNFIGKIMGTENEELLRKILREGRINFAGTSSSHHIMEASAEQIHKIVKLMKKVGGKDTIIKFRVSEPGPYPRKVLAEGGLISIPELKGQDIRSILKLLEGQTK